MTPLEYLGIPYVHRGRTRAGCDCFGLVKLYLHEELGITVAEPTGYAEQWYLDKPDLILNSYEAFGFEATSLPQPGDVLLLHGSGGARHLGVVIDNGYFLHTSICGTSCQPYTHGHWFKRIVAVLRYRKGANSDSSL